MAAVVDWWHAKTLQQLSAAQWEQLCDGCGKCCLHKLEDEETGEVFLTRVHCRYLDAHSCRCRDYPNRLNNVPDCVQLDVSGSQEYDWLPNTCAYRLRAQQQQLPDWHPLISGDPDSVHRAGVSVRGRSLSEEHVHPDAYEENVVHWIE